METVVTDVGEAIGNAVEFFDTPLIDIALPDNMGTLKVWATVHEITLTKETIDEISEEANLVLAMQYSLIPYPAEG